MNFFEYLIESNMFSSIVVAVVATFLTFQLSIRKFRSERWWELKIVAYQRIIEALHYSKEFSNRFIEVEEGERTITDEEEKKLREKSRKANEEILKTIDIGIFLFSDEAIERLKQYEKDSYESSKQEFWSDYLNHDWDVTNSCLVDLIKLAKKDLEGTQQK